MKWQRDKELTLNDEIVRELRGKAHVLWAHGAKAKRISCSTSHAETLASISGLEAASLVAVRLAEMMYVPGRATIQPLLAAQEFGVKQLPVGEAIGISSHFVVAMEQRRRTKVRDFTSWPIVKHASMFVCVGPCLCLYGINDSRQPHKTHGVSTPDAPVELRSCGLS